MPNADILPPVMRVMSNSALIAELTSIAGNANYASVLVAESRSLVTIYASIIFAPPGAKKDMLVVVQKAKRVLLKRPKYYLLGRLSSQR